MLARLIAIGTAGVIAGLAPVAAQAQGAPAGLHGKSIILAWIENRMQRPAGSDASFRQVGIAQSLSVYVSSQGRLFSRRTATNPKGGGGKREGTGDTGRSATGGVRSSSFEGSNLVVRTELAGGARLINVSFSGGGCTASIVVARESGRPTMRVKSFAHGGMIEVQSVTADGVKCSLREGNVFQ